MKSSNIPRRLLLLLVAFAATSVVMVVAYTLLLRGSIDSSATVALAATGKLNGNYQLLESLGKAHSDVQKFMRLKDPDEMEVLQKELAQHQQAALQLINQTGTESAGLKIKFDAFVAADNQVTEMVMRGNVVNAYEKFFTVSAARQEELLNQLQQNNAAVMKAASEALSGHRTQARTAMSWRSGLLGIVLITVVAFGWRLRNDIVAKLTRISDVIADATEKVFNSTSQISNSSQILAEGASEQAASLEETSASLEEMSSMIQRNSENANKANDLAKQTRTAADKGAEDMTAMTSAMETIKKSSDDIAKIIKTIDEIAFQTNILALNAAVEAARAGEAGMGFAVVADEVRNLAQRSAVAAKETATKIEGAIGNTARGVALTHKVGANLNAIVTSAREMDDLAAEVANASREQSQGISQINTAISQMDKVTQSNAAGAEESAAAAQDLNGQAQLMKQAVNELMHLTGHAASSSTAAGSSDYTVPPNVFRPGKKAASAPAPATAREPDFSNF